MSCADVTENCTAPNDSRDALEKAIGYTLDAKFGVYAFLQIAGFYIDTGWIGDKAHATFGGLYWGIKNVIASCVEYSDYQNGFLLDASQSPESPKGVHFSSLPNSSHAGSMINNRMDDTIVSDTYPSGNISTICQPKFVEKKPGSMARRWWSGSELFRRGPQWDDTRIDGDKGKSKDFDGINKNRCLQKPD